MKTPVSIYRSRDISTRGKSFGYEVLTFVAINQTFESFARKGSGLLIVLLYARTGDR